MSYRDPEQSIETPARAILESIAQLRKAALSRIASGEWSNEHCLDLRAAMASIPSDLEAKLATLASETW